MEVPILHVSSNRVARSSVQIMWSIMEDPRAFMKVGWSFSILVRGRFSSAFWRITPFRLVLVSPK